MRITPASSLVSHLIFVDDSLFFFKMKLRECDEIMKAIKVYGKILGQHINFENLSLLFGKRVSGNIKKEIKTTLGIDRESVMNTYLGITKDINGSTCMLFAFLKEKLDHTINGWSVH